MIFHGCTLKDNREWPWTAVYKNTFITEMACWLPVNICLSFVRRFSCCDSLITICFYFLGKWQLENEAASFLTKLNPEKMRWQLQPLKCYRTFFHVFVKARLYILNITSLGVTAGTLSHSPGLLCLWKEGFQKQDTFHLQNNFLYSIQSFSNQTIWGVECR